MAKLPILSSKKLIKILIKMGYQITRQKGSHIRLFHLSKDSITVPDHKIIGKGLLRKVLRDSDVTVDEFIKFL